MLNCFPDCVELADMVRNQAPETLHILSEWAYKAFMDYNSVVAGDNIQARFEEPLVAIFLAGYYTGMAVELK